MDYTKAELEEAMRDTSMIGSLRNIYRRAYRHANAMQRVLLVLLSPLFAVFALIALLIIPLAYLSLKISDAVFWFRTRKLTVDERITLTMSKLKPLKYDIPMDRMYYDMQEIQERICRERREQVAASQATATLGSRE